MNAMWDDIVTLLRARMNQRIERCKAAGTQRKIMVLCLTAHVCIGICVAPRAMRAILLMGMNLARWTEMVQWAKFKGVK
eukprot:5213689-Pyramimonas_sp.AAC.1